MTKLLIIFLRPIVYALAAILISAFGYRLFKRMMTAIGVFLTLLTVGGLYVSYDQIQKVIDPFNFNKNEDVMLLIVAIVMTLFIGFFSIIYLTLGLAGEGEDEEKEKRKSGKWYRIYSNIMLLGIKLVPALAFIGFSLPLLFLEEPAGKIVGGGIEVISCIVAFFIIRSHIRETKEKNNDDQE